MFIYSTTTGWGILIVSLSEGEREVDVFSKHRIFSTLFELKTVADWTTTTNYPQLPLDCIDIEFDFSLYFPTDSSDSDYFDNLLKVEDSDI